MVINRNKQTVEKLKQMLEKPTVEVVGPTALPDIESIPLVSTEPGWRIDNPVALHALLCPEIKLYTWQQEELMRYAGYLSQPYTTASRFHFNTTNPYQASFPCANGSGKDMILIALTSVWDMLRGCQNRVVGTSSSKEQLKFQTQPHIKTLCDRFNAKFGNPIRYVEFHFQAFGIASEIKLFATNTAGRAEGYHPFGNGDLSLFTNETKSLDPDIISALSRCFGWSRWLNVSSPGEPRGYFYEKCRQSIQYPNPLTPGAPFSRRISADLCPHITEAAKREVELIGGGKESALYLSSVLAEFAFLDSDTIISPYSWLVCKQAPVPQVGTDIGIGLDVALGGGDFTRIYVRQGNRVVYTVRINEKDPDRLVDRIDRELSPWKSLQYRFNADAGGIGLPLLRKLKNKGWHVNLCNNQSPSHNKRFFLNLGAEMYYHTRSLVHQKQIIIPKDDLLETQITARKPANDPNQQGKFALEPKKNLPKSPDAADAFVLCFWSFRPADSFFRPNAPTIHPPIDEVAKILRLRPELYTEKATSSPFKLHDTGQHY